MAQRETLPRRVLAHLAERVDYTVAMADVLGVRNAAVAGALTSLRERGLVAVVERVPGAGHPRVYYGITDDGVEALAVSPESIRRRARVHEGLPCADIEPEVPATARRSRPVRDEGWDSSAWDERAYKRERALLALELRVLQPLGPEQALLEVLMQGNGPPRGM